MFTRNDIASYQSRFEQGSEYNLLEMSHCYS